MEWHGKQLIGGEWSAESSDSFTGIDPRSGDILPGQFFEASDAEIDRAVRTGEESFESFRRSEPEVRARLLEAIADEMMESGETLLERASAETGHPPERCAAERARAVGQARLFAEMVREGSWVDARIDRAIPDRTPIPKPDIRSMFQPVGPVAVFGASNFPIAISVLGADTISAFSAGCPVVIKAHPAHPGTCEAAAVIIGKAIRRVGMPEGILSMVHGRSHRVGVRVVEHPALKAAAFTGSLGGGRALFDAANARPVPIPFYAEMGSVNPIFVLPGALRERASEVAGGFVQSLTTGVGQFCTNPGLILGLKEEPGWQELRTTATEAVERYDPQTMLHCGIHHAFEQGIQSMQQMSGLRKLGRSTREADESRSEAACHLFETDARGFRSNPELYDEVFGPVSTLVGCENAEELEEFAAELDGSLTASIHGTEEDLRSHAGLVSILERKVGRLIFNGFPVGLEVCHSIHHGGPYPATCHSYFTSIGTRCIYRFVRPVCYQSWPQELLPPELRDDNPRGVRQLTN